MVGQAEFSKYCLTNQKPSFILWYEMEMKMSKIAISLNATILEEIEQQRKAYGESRSAFFRRVLQCFFEFSKKQKESSEVTAYVEGYKKRPETPEEIEVVHRLGRSA